LHAAPNDSIEINRRGEEFRMTTTVETSSPRQETDLRDLAQDVVARAMAGGASVAEAVVREGDEFSTVVRLGQVETLKEAGSKSIGVRVFYGQRAASTYSSDFSHPAIDRMVKSALELAKITSEDPFGGIPEADQLGSLKGDLDLYHKDVYSLPGEERINYARRAEKAALDADPRIKNSEGGSFDAATGRKVLANSHGFLGEYRRSYCSVSAVPIAQDDAGHMQRDYWYSVSRNLAKLDPPEQVGKIAAQRTLRRLGARKVKTAKVPIVFDPMVANSILEHIFEGVNGDSVYRGASFLAGKLGEKIAGPNVTIIDDGTMVGGFGSSPFDGEGVPTRRTVVV
jgi:PmbA protein